MLYVKTLPQLASVPAVCFVHVSFCGHQNGHVLHPCILLFTNKGQSTSTALVVFKIHVAGLFPVSTRRWMPSEPDIPFHFKQGWVSILRFVMFMSTTAKRPLSGDQEALEIICQRRATKVMDRKQMIVGWGLTEIGSGDNYRGSFSFSVALSWKEGMPGGVTKGDSSLRVGCVF